MIYLELDQVEITNKAGRIAEPKPEDLQGDELHLELNECQINALNINGEATLMINTITEPIYIKGKRVEWIKQLWELLARLEPSSLETINQAIANLKAIANLATKEEAGPDLEAMASHTADLLAEVLEGALS